MYLNVSMGFFPEQACVVPREIPARFLLLCRVRHSPCENPDKYSSRFSTSMDEPVLRNNRLCRACASFLIRMLIYIFSSSALGGST